jgi:hypothetical protein
MSRWMRPLRASVANSCKVISEIAEPAALSRAWSMATLSLSGKFVLIERKPDDDVGINQNHLSSPHSSGEIAAETMSSIIVPFPARKL